MAQIKKSDQTTQQGNLGRRLLTRLLAKVSDQMALDEVPDVILRLADSGRILQVSGICIKAWGYSPENLVGTNIAELVHSEDRENYFLSMAHAISSADIASATFRLKTSLDEYIWVEMRLHKTRCKPVELLTSSRDITERKSLQEHLEVLAHRDPLTELANRASLVKHLHDFSRRKTDKFAVFLMDLDRFKAINDNLGHGAGDALLIEIAHRLRAVTRHDDIVARMGGDEFVVLAKGLTSQGGELRTLCEKIIEVVGHPFEIDGHILYPRTSIGVAFFPDHGQDGTTLIKHADNAMYSSKKIGGSTFSVYQSMSDSQVIPSLSIEYKLHRALAENLFSLVFQPIICPKTGSVLTAESLIRLEIDGERVSPAQFIPVAEQTGLIGPIGEWVLQEALKCAKDWNSMGFRIPVSVNLSRRQFSMLDFVDRLTALITEADISPTLLEIELTESMLMENSNLVLDTLNALKNLGVKLALDDFGTGYSSMNYLKFMPLDRLKVDKSFVDELDNLKGQAVISAIIKLGHSLGLKVVAEGVELEKQRLMLASLGCDGLQGYLLARPMALPDFVSYLHRHAKAGIDHD